MELTALCDDISIPSPIRHSNPGQNASILESYPWLQEFLDSGISADLALANVAWVEGDDALAEFLGDAIARSQRQHIHLNSDARYWWQKYGNLWDGAWMARPEVCPVPYFKPVKPRMDRESGKFIKYETPPKSQSLPLFPVLPGGQAWQDLGHGAIAITEGLKKALTLTEYGLPAVALRGVTQWSLPRLPGVIDRELYPELAAVVAGRDVFICFDQDEKVKTRSQVSGQALKLAKAVTKAGGRVRVLAWDGGQGKGIDDYLAAMPAGDRHGALELLKKSSLSLEQFQRRATLAKAAAILAAAPPVAAVTSEGEYLPALPALQSGAIHWLDAPMNSGKTYQMGRSWVGPWVAAGGVVVVLSPLNSLGAQTAKSWNLPHIHDYNTDRDSRRALEADITHRGGIVACLNSVHRVISLLPGDRPVLLVLDEAAQVLDGAGEGGTLRGVWSQRWEDFITLTKRAINGGAIALAEAGLDQPTIDLVSKLGDAAGVVGIRHQKQADPWSVQVHQATPLSGFRAKVLADLRSGLNVLFTTSSQAEGRRLEKAAAAAGVTVVRVDSQTNESGRYRDFFESPESWLYEAQPQLLILSPSAKTGLSIEGGISAEGAYFDKVYGYFPSLDTDTHLQLLGRYRPAVPRVLWVPAYIQPDHYEKPNRLAISSDLEMESANFARLGGFQQSPTDPDNDAITAYLASRRARRWAQKVNPAGALFSSMAAAGHQVEVLSQGEKDDSLSDLWDSIKEDIAREDADLYASLQLNSSHTWKWASEVLSGIDSTYQDRCTAQKVRTALRFPGLDWNCPQLWYDAQFAPKDNLSGPLAPGAALWAEAEFSQVLWLEDTKEAEKLLTQRLKAVHLLPKSGGKAALASLFRPMIEKLLSAGEVMPGGQVESEIKATALQAEAFLRRYWRLNITADQGDTAIANKIARKFGLTLSRSRRISGGLSPAGRETWLWVYSVEASPVWRCLVAARRWALEHCTEALNDAFNKFVQSSSGILAEVTSDPPDPDMLADDLRKNDRQLPLTA